MKEKYSWPLNRVGLAGSLAITKFKFNFMWRLPTDLASQFKATRSSLSVRVTKRISHI